LKDGWANVLHIGVPTRYGNFPAQWKAFWDHTGGLWTKQALAGKMFGTFVSTGTPGGGQELTAFQSLSVAIHHGMVFIPIGYQIGEITNLEEVHGGSPWGNDTFSPQHTHTQRERERNERRL
jgi:NAD(P)H dehydrogenase (quinone)